MDFRRTGLPQQLDNAGSCGTRTMESSMRTTRFPFTVAEMGFSLIGPCSPDFSGPGR